MNQLSEARMLELQDKFFEFSFNDREPDKDFFDSITNPLEYHYIANIYNWDDGIEVLSWIINSPLCDAGTAKMIFWRAQPSYYTRFLTREEAGYDADVFVLLKTIIDNFERDIYTNHGIKYIPEDDPAADATDEPDPSAKWSIPEFMKDAANGTEVIFT